LVVGELEAEPPDAAFGLCTSDYRPELGELSEVLGSGGEQELVAGAAWSAQPKAAEPGDALELGEEHLDLLAPVPSALIGRGIGQGLATGGSPFSSTAGPMTFTVSNKLLRIWRKRAIESSFPICAVWDHTLP
jgi:hypothetical protein